MSLVAASPELSGFRTGAALPAIGQAARFACDGRATELWRLPADAERVARRLVELGGRGVGGFVAGGIDAEGAWLARAAAEPSLASWLREHAGPVEWRRAVALATSLAEAASVCEQASLFPGTLEPGALVARDGDALEIRADALVGALVGAGAAGAASSAAGSTRWLAPEQAAGGSADNASNRYLIGLVLYRLIGGEHPFASRGLRLGLDDQAQRGAPPFGDEVAAALPAGLQSLCLRLLEPDAARRPRSAKEIAAALRGFGTDAPAPARRADPRAEPPVARRAEPRAEPPVAPHAEPRIAPRVEPRADPRPAPGARLAPSRWLRSVLVLGPLLAGVALAIWIVVALRPSPAKAIAAGAAAPLAAATSLEDCASCHPRHAAEWSRSVMAHAVESPLFQSLEMLIQEQVGRDRDCPDGAGVLRTKGAGSCVERSTGIAVTGSGGALWCVNCHAPGENLIAALPAWNRFDPSTRRPLRDLLPASTMEGIGCAFCHQVGGPVRPGNEALGIYEGNPSWISSLTGVRFSQRPEDLLGVFGIANSGYAIDRAMLLGGANTDDADLVAGGAHRRASAEARDYLASSEFCGSCHDVRLFGTDAIAGPERGEHFKRLRNAYSEWAAWRDQELRAGRSAATCQDCHMSLYPGVCVAAPSGGATDGACPDGTIFEARPPGSYPTARTATGAAPAPGTTHYFSGVDVPLTAAFDASAIDDATIDVAGVPLGARQRRDLLLAKTFRLELDAPRRNGGALEIPIVVENVGAGHRVPAGFSQEREFWIHLTVTNARGDVIYEVGRVDRGDQDLRDKIFLRINTSDEVTDGRGRPLGLFGADVADGPDVPRWSPPPARGGTSFRGRGLINFQNGFLRCVRCIGEIDGAGSCQPGPGQQGRRADRYADGDYDPDSGECRSNLRGLDAFLETYFPVGALDSTRGVARAPDAIIDTRSLPPGVPVRYVYDLDARGDGPFTVEARLLFRAFPPYLLQGFIDYELAQDRLGRRPSGPLIDRSALDRLDVVELAVVRAEIP